MKKLHAISLLLNLVIVANAQNSKDVFSLTDTTLLVAQNVIMQATTWRGRKSLRVIDAKTESNTELKFVSLANYIFHNGVIEITLAGQPIKQASEAARGFVGIAFRISDDNSQFECFYLRPTNGRALDQVRRNHTAQYISFPHYPWHKLRKSFLKNMSPT